MISTQESTSSAKVKDEKEDDFTPKDKEEEKYIPPPPLPFILVCPKPECSKRYRHHNGLRYHVSHSHPGVRLRKPFFSSSPMSSQNKLARFSLASLSCLMYLWSLPE
jgi:hypothetical protein